MSRSVSALTLALALFCGACSRGPQYYIDKGNRLAAAGKLDDAALNYRKTIQADPRNGPAYYQVGLIMVRLRKTQEAYSMLTRAAELMPNREDVQLKLADFMLTSYLSDRRHPRTLYNKVKDISDRLLAKDASSYDGLRLQAHLLNADRKYKEAEESYSKADKAKPMQTEVVMAWAETLLQDGQGKEGEQLALQLIDKDKTFGPVYDLLYRYYAGANRRADAENILKTRVGNNPTDAGSVLELASLYAASSKETEMQAVLQRMLDNPKAFPDGHLQIGDLYSRMQRWNDALHQYDEGAKADPKRKIAYLRKIADVWLALGQGERADSVVTEILKQQPDDEAAKGVRASILLATRKPENVNKAVATLQTLVEKNPGNATWHFNLGRGLAAKGDLDGARIQFQEAVKSRPSLLPARIALVELSQSRGDYKATLQYANAILALYPNLMRIRLVRAVSLMYTGKDDEARTELTNLEKAFPNDREVQLQLAMMDLHQKKFPAAEEHFRKLAETGDKAGVRAISGLVETLAAENQFDKAIASLQDELKKTPKSIPIHSMLARTAALAGKYDMAIDQYQQLLAAAPQSEPASLALGSAYRMKGDFPNAIAYLEKARSLSPNDPAPMVRLGGIMALTGREAQALDLYRKALKLKPDDATTLNNAAYLIAETGGNLDEAVRLVQRAMQLDSSQPSYTDTLGWIYLKKNLTDSAIQVFRGLTGNHPDSSTYHYHFGMALMKQGNKIMAKAELKTALSDKPLDAQRHNIESALAQIGS